MRKNIKKQVFICAFTLRRGDTVKQVVLFPPQKEVIQKGLLDRQEHLLLNMETGTGKTYLAEMAIEDVLRAGFKALYLTPLRAIASEQYDHWQQRFPNTKIISEFFLKFININLVVSL